MHKLLKQVSVNSSILLAIVLVALLFSAPIFAQTETSDFENCLADLNVKINSCEESGDVQDCRAQFINSCDHLKSNAQAQGNCNVVSTKSFVFGNDEAPTYQISGCRNLPEIIATARSTCSAGTRPELDSSHRFFRCVSGAASNIGGRPHEGGSGPPGARTPGEPQPPGTPSGPAATVAASDITSLGNEINQLEARIERECTPQKEQAEKCCLEPETCVGQAFGASRENSNLGIKLLQATAGGVMTLGNANIGQLCNSMKNVSYAAMALNTVMAGVCTNKVGQCKKSCKDMLAELDILEARHSSLFSVDLLDDPATKQAKNRSESAIKELDRKLTNSVRACMTYDNATVRAGMQAAASYQAAKTAELCQEQAGVKIDKLDTPDQDVNCASPGAAGIPICVARCMRPEGKDKPECANILRDRNISNRGNDPSVGPRGSGPTGFNDRFAVDPDDEDGQEAMYADTKPENAGINKGQGSGGGGGGGLPGQGGGDSGDGGMGSAGSSIDANILKGTTSGNGYSYTGARTGSSGGYSGGSGSGRNPASDPNQKFNLKDFLPGGKMAPKRGLAGMVGTNPEIGSKTDDIFKRITGRFYQICLQDRLYDCNTLRSMKRGP